jgi:hypothetical protein
LFQKIALNAHKVTVNVCSTPHIKRIALDAKKMNLTCFFWEIFYLPEQGRRNDLFPRVGGVPCQGSDFHMIRVRVRVTVNTTKSRRRRLGASHEATDTLHRLMGLAPYCPVGMVIAFAVESVTFYFFVD